MPSIAARTFKRRWNSGGTFRICTVEDMQKSYFHAFFMSMTLRPRSTIIRALHGQMDLRQALGELDARQDDACRSRQTFQWASVSSREFEVCPPGRARSVDQGSPLSGPNSGGGRRWWVAAS
jgi:hypothetical protein